MVTGEQLKEIRKNFGLKIREVSRATFISEGAISNIENNTKQPSLDTLEVLANFYGYELELNLVEKKRISKKINFYKPKSVKQLLELSKEDLVEYIFVTQDDDVISKIVNIEKEALKHIGLRDLRKILDEKIQKLDNLIVYYKMNNLYSGIEKDVVDTIEYFVEELEDAIEYFVEELDNQENTFVTKFLSSIHYIDLNVKYDYGFEGWDACLDDIKVYDKNMNLMGGSGSYADDSDDDEYIGVTIEEMAVRWRDDAFSNQELMYAMRKPLQIRF